MNIVKSMGIYTGANLLNAAIPFLFLPLLTNYLSTEDYGILSNFNVLANLMVPFVGFNLMASVQIQYLKKEVDNQVYLSSSMRLVLALSVVLTLLMFCVGGWLENNIGVPKEFLCFIALYAMFNVVSEVLLAIWRMEDKAINYGVFRVLRTIIEVSLVLFFIVKMKMNFEGTIYALLISYLAACIGAFFILWRKNLLFGNFNIAFVKHALNYGLPLIPHTLSGVAIMYSDKLILTYYWGLSANGIYAVGFMVGQMIGLLQNSFNQAWVPWVFQKLKTGNLTDKKRMVKITYLYIVAILCAVFVLWAIIPFIYSFLGKDFQAGIDLVLYIALGFAFNGMYKMVSVYIFYIEKTKIIAYTSVGVALLNIALNFYLIPIYHAQGAAIATMIAMAFQFVVTWWVSSRIYKMPWNLKKAK